jgi:hypothetical protein
MLRKVNPFLVTKAVDLSDEEIESLWISIGGNDTDTLFHPKSLMPVILMGGKGSGKTHWMRYYSYPLQQLRHRSLKLQPLEGLARDGYIGIYVLLGGLNSERFRGRGQSDEIWRSLFEYYFELWLAQEILHILVNLAREEPSLAALESELCGRICDLFDEPPRDIASTFKGLFDWCADAQRQLDAEVNNVIFTKSFSTRVRITRGKLLFGIPKIVTSHVEKLKGVVFSYQLDEFENILEQQQKYVNSLIRERSSPSTFRIGSRLYGVKTYQTYADDEENREGSEFVRVILDHRLRQDPKGWEEFAFRLVQRRLEVYGAMTDAPVSYENMERIFETPDYSWSRTTIFKLMGEPAIGTGPHFEKLSRKLERAMDTDTAPGLRTNEQKNEILRCMIVEGRPLLEKINMLMLYQEWSRGHSLSQAAASIREKARTFLDNPHARSPYATKVQHFASDMVAQLLREAGRRQLLYFGIRNFIRMSEGLPRTLVVMLKNIWDWAIYKERGEFLEKISQDAQVQGVLDSAEWFMETMRKPGTSGTAIRTGIERLARLFENNRFSDKPTECSLLGFSVRERDLAESTKELILMAEQRSFLIRISQGEIDRNTQERLSKFQLSATLAPKWNLPVARRGIAKLSPGDVDLIFDPKRQADFDRLDQSWVERMTAPGFGESRRSRVAAHAVPNLFEGRK